MKIAAKSRADSVQTDRSRAFGSTTSLVLTDFALGYVSDPKVRIRNAAKRKAAA